MPLRFALLTLCASIILLAGCSQQPPHKPAEHVHFEVLILPNGTKLFEFAVKPPPVTRPASHALPQTESPGSRRLSPERLLKQLEQTLAETGYCREGYQVLERYPNYLRGECREAATGEDRQRFPRAAQQPRTTSQHSGQLWF